MTRPIHRILAIAAIWIMFCHESIHAQVAPDSLHQVIEQRLKEGNSWIQNRQDTSLVNLEQNPLYVVDGKVFAVLPAHLSKEAIKTIHFLRPASATAIYGGTAKDGVVLITTVLDSSKMIQGY